MLAGKRIVLGVTGGIAAYKAVEISFIVVGLVLLLSLRSWRSAW